MNLRSEAKALPFDQLTRDQQKTVTSLSLIIRDLLQRPRPQLSSTGYLPSETDRDNFTVLVSGDRGMGKTSLMLTLRSIFDVRDTTNSFNVIPELGNTVDGSRIQWLHPLDMERHFESSNLLVSICVRLQRICEKSQIADCQSGLWPNLQPRKLGELKQELMQLMVSAAIAWDGDMSARRAHIIPDQLGHETRQLEQARLELGQRLSQITNELARLLSTETSSAVFILPIDDFDMNPARALDVIRLLRILNHGQHPVPIMPIVLGDKRQLERVLQLALTGEQARIARMQLDDSVIERPMFARQRYQTKETLRKLIPLSQRFRLPRLTWTDVRSFRRATHTPTLEQQFQWIPHRVATLNLTESNAGTQDSIRSWWDFVATSPFENVLSHESRHAWQAPLIYDDSVRSTLDLTLNIEAMLNEVRRHLDEQQRDMLAPLRATNTHKTSIQQNSAADWVSLDEFDSATQFSNLLVDQFQEAILGDSELMNLTQEQLAPVESCYVPSQRVDVREDDLPRSSSINWRVIPGVHTLSLDLQNARLVDIPDIGAYRREVRIRRANQWQGGVQLASETIELSPRVCSTLMLAHDTIVSHPQYNIFDSTLISEKNVRGIACTEWRSRSGQQMVSVPWLAPPFRTFRDCDHFVAAMNQIEFRAASPISGGVASPFPEFVCWWLALGTALWDPRVLNNESITANGISKLSDAKIFLGKTISDACKLILKSRMRGYSGLPRVLVSSLEEWLRHIVLLLSPEVGVTADMAEQLLGPSKHLLGNVIQGAEYRMRSVRAGYAAEFKDSGLEGLALVTFSDFDFDEKEWIDASQQTFTRLSVIADLDTLAEFEIRTAGRAHFFDRIRKGKESDGTGGRRWSFTRDSTRVVELLRKMQEAADSRTDDWDDLLDLLGSNIVRELIAHYDAAQLSGEVDTSDKTSSRQHSGMPHRHPLNCWWNGFLCPSNEEIVQAQKNRPGSTSSL